MIGPAQALAYPRFVFANAASAAHGSTLALMFGWNGLIGVTIRSVPPVLLMLITLPLGLAGVAAAIAVAPRGWASDARFALAWTALTVATLLADPNLYLQDTILLGPPVLLLMAHAQGRDRAWAGRWACALWLTSALGYVPNLHGVNPLAMAGVALLGWATWSLARASSSPESAPPMHAASAAHAPALHERAAHAARPPVAAPPARG